MIYLLIAIAFILIMIAEVKKADITFAPILGIMFGALYSFTDYEEGREHTLQCCILFLSITVQWVTTHNG